MTTTAPWTCPTCKTLIGTPFCPTCGEHPLHERELTLRGLLEHMFEAFTNIDSRLMGSFRHLVIHPGKLTLAYLQGQRKPYIAPVSLFLIVNVLFFAMESFTGGQVFTTPMNSHLHTQPWSDSIQGLVAHRLAVKHTTLAAYAPIFDQALALKARSLIILMALSFALAPWIVFFRSKAPLIAHAVFSLHLYSFLLLLLCVASAIPPLDVMLGGAGLASEHFDHVISLTLVSLCAIYLYFAIGMVYRPRSRTIRVLQTLALTVAVAAIVLGYRFALLLITLYSA